MEASHHSSTQQPSDSRAVKRSLILAGGGMKVAFQAGVLQVLLDEADLGFDQFDHVDGCSGGVFNLAMVCQGCSGEQIADNWRDFPVKRGIQANWRHYWKLFFAKSMLKMDRFRKNILRDHWRLDWDRINKMNGREGLVATFNAYNFSRQELDVREADAVDEDFLVSCVSLPMWYPPSELGGQTYIDAVYITDANLEEAIDRDADELWVIWTVSRRNEWVDGFVGNYFGVIETAANGHFKRICDRIDRSNKAIGDHKQGEFDRPIEVKVIHGDVPLNYLVDLNSDRFTEAVELGVAAGRKWCLAQRPPIPVAPIRVDPESATSLTFEEKLEGFLTPGATDYDKGYQDGKQAGRSATLRLHIDVDDIDDFISLPEHQARITGEIECEALGGRLPVQDGRFNLMPFEGNFDERWMFYWLPFEDGGGRKLVLSGYKRICDQPGRDLWPDTTTLFTHLLEGWAAPPAPDALIDRFRHGEAEGTVLGAGIVKIDRPGFLKLLTTLRAQGPSKRARSRAIVRFGLFFLGGLWDAYGARKLLPASPF